MKPYKFFLFIPGLVYILIAISWQYFNINSITGDEPHYLLTADSIIRDGDLKVINNHKIETPVSKEMPKGYKFISAHDVNGYSVHGIGLPLLVLLPYCIGGVTGAKFFIAILSGIIPFLIYNCINLIQSNKRLSILTALVISLSLPFSVSSNQIYPDLLTGIIIFYCSIKLFTICKNQKFILNKKDTIVVSILIGVLPWLHIKSLAPMLLLYVYFIILYLKSDVVQTMKINQYFSILVSTIVIIISSFLLFTYNFYAFNSIWGPHNTNAISTDIQKITMIFTGLHIDRIQGLFFQNPLLMLGLLGITALIIEVPMFALMTGILYLSIVIPNSAHINWYGGWSFAGRFIWSASLLWCFFLGYTLNILKDKYGYSIIYGIFILSLSIQLFYALNVLTISDCLYNTALSASDEWTRRSPFFYFLPINDFYSAKFLPSFRNFSNYFLSVINWLAISSVFIFLFIGFYLQNNQTKKIIIIFICFLMVSIVALFSIPTDIQSATFRGRDLPGKIGFIKKESRIATGDQIGFVSFGPYIKLHGGKYEILINYSTDNYKQNGLIWDSCVIESNSKFILLDSGILPPSQNGFAVFDYIFTIPYYKLGVSYEFRIFTKGGTNISVNSISVKPISF